MKKITKKEQFLRESNAIEGVFDEESLQQANIAWGILIAQQRLTIGVILKIHKVLMKGKLMPYERGYFRTVDVRVGNYLAPDHSKVQRLMENFIEDIKVSYTAGEIKKDHIAFEMIHPFVDGNGRIGRMLMNWQRLRNNLPLLIIKNAEKQEYYKWFK